MIEVERRKFDNTEALELALAEEVREAIAAGQANRECALLALSGGSSPFPIYRALAQENLMWPDVMVMPVDDRLVPEADPLSNTAKLREVFEPVGARVLGLFRDADKRSEGETALEVVDLPPDFTWLGMGGDGHFASVFPGPDFDKAFATEDDSLIVTPDPLPPEAPVGRITLSPAAIAKSRRLVLVISGRDKAAVFDRALAEGEASGYPIGRFLEQCSPALTVYEGPS